MTTQILQSNKLYILSGPSASGKSFLTNQLLAQGMTKESIISSDTLRENILGSFTAIDEQGEYQSLIGWDIASKEVFQVMVSIANIRLKQKLTTIIDSTALNDSDRKRFIEVAKANGVDYEVLIFNVPEETLKERLLKRQQRFSLDVLKRQLNSFQKTSEYKFRTINQEDTFLFIPNLIDTLQLDVIGDTHGLLKETISLLNKNGWTVEDGALSHKDENRKLLFLGDILDRGKESIDLLILLKNSVVKGQVALILGNHESKLIQSYEQLKNKGIVRGSSLSSSQTFMDFLLLPTELQEELYNFLKNSPTHYVSWVDKTTGNLVDINKPINHDNTLKVCFIHANNRYFSPYNITYSHALYGEKIERTLDKNSVYIKQDTDLLYEEAYKKGINDHIYIRGHILETSKQNHIYSLEDDQAFAGHLVLLKYDGLINSIKNNNWNSEYNLFEGNIMKEKTEFDFKAEMADKVKLLKTLTELYDAGLITDGWRKDNTGVKQEHPDGFKIYKYSKKVHFKRLWKDHPLLEKTRGLGLDIAGNIIVHPFDKLYNYGEYDVGQNLDNSKKVQVIEKLNGFLGCISKHPFKNELLFSTTGSYDSPYVDYIKSFIDEETNNRLLEYFSKNKTTLMFEVIHKDDQHIIEYPEKDFGLHLIGARELNYNSPIYTESQLDSLGKELNFRRPYWYEATFSEVLESLQNSELEGFMIRDAEDNTPLMKIKTNYYLVTKFVGRMGPKMVHEMFGNSEVFKERHMDEEFYPIVDKIVKAIPKQEFMDMVQKDRVEFVRNITNEVRNEFKNSKKHDFKPK